MNPKAWWMVGRSAWTLPVVASAFVLTLEPPAAAQPKAANPAGAASFKAADADKAAKPQVRTYSSVTVVDDPKQVPPLPTGRKGDAATPAPASRGSAPVPPELKTPPELKAPPQGSEKSPAADRPDDKRGESAVLREPASARQELRQELRELRQELRESRGAQNRDREHDGAAAGSRAPLPRNADKPTRLERVRERLRQLRD